MAGWYVLCLEAWGPRSRSFRFIGNRATERRARKKRKRNSGFFEGGRALAARGWAIIGPIAGFDSEWNSPPQWLPTTDCFRGGGTAPIFRFKKTFWLLTGHPWSADVTGLSG